MIAPLVDEISEEYGDRVKVVSTRPPSRRPRGLCGLERSRDGAAKLPSPGTRALCAQILRLRRARGPGGLMRRVEGSIMTFGTVVRGEDLHLRHPRGVAAPRPPPPQALPWP